MTLIDLTNVRDVAVIEPLDATDVSAVSCCGGVCHVGPSESSVNAVERARG